jgi:hypothetical protein
VPLVLAIITWVVIIARRKKVAGQSFIYLGVGAAGFFAGIAIMIPIVGIIAVIGAFLILVITFLTCLAVIVATVLQFLNNLRYLR